jgi:hypothetical protein
MAEWACPCARVVLITQHTTRRHIVICGLSGSTIFFDIIPYTVQLSRKEVIEQKMCILIFSAAFI